FSRFCDPITASYSLADENLLSWAAIRTPADIEHRKTLGIFNQFQLGDNNGNPNDGNSAANGELGDFYGGPAVGALALEYWFNQGFGQSMQIGGSKLTIQQAADRLGGFMQIPVNGGLEDDWFVFGFQSYLAVTGFSEQKIEFTRDVSYSVLRNWAEEIGGVVMFAVDGVPGRWLAVDGFSGLPTTQNAFRVVVSDPFDATTKFVFWRDTQSGSEVFIGGAWRDVALMTRLLPANPPPVGRTQFNDGFIPIPSPFSLQIDGAAQNLVDGNFYFFTLEMSDFDGNLGAETVLLRYICDAFAAGDYDGDGLANISDLVFAINFQLFGGPAPVGGAGRADANCNGGVETSDLHHYVFWLFAGGPAPCQ
ncbi:MAG: hypothetical protein IH914_06155, partial [candidate division Zixibacteria bacterium]|nr:hypothetical protein [candidate division Zixibacteria bacterium]